MAEGERDQRIANALAEFHDRQARPLRQPQPYVILLDAASGILEIFLRRQAQGPAHLAGHRQDQGGCVEGI